MLADLFNQELGVTANSFEIGGFVDLANIGIEIHQRQMCSAKARLK